MQPARSFNIRARSCRKISSFSNKDEYFETILANRVIRFTVLTTGTLVRDDMVIAAEKDLVYTKAQIKVLYHQVRLATTNDEQRTLQQLQIQELEKLQCRQRQRIFDVEDEIGKSATA